ncbi:MAG: UDP-N-acetylmuramoyl-tripeptide--D-alanyl-D-alanine ligase [Bacteroidales bacterium]|nr:UDP-N-acetylmuramoyl-tripeptide--D-alanyl-D-alanine ligase [Bacteroidales bacterium]
MKIEELYKTFKKHPNICTDSRKSENNSIFFALKGEKFNGNIYAVNALGKCEYAVVDEKKYAIDDRFVLVNDVLSTLQELAKHHRIKMNIPLIAITGTNGKTTTKELTKLVLEKNYKVCSTQGNYNNHIGVPLTILRIDEKDDICVLEMGANHFGEIQKLCDIARPDYGLVTNIGKAHLKGFKSLDGVKKAKGELFTYLYNNNGVAFINSDNEILPELNPPHKTIIYGSSKFTHCQGKLLDSEIFLELRWLSTNKSLEDDIIVEWDNDIRFIKTKLVGKYNFENVLAAICIGNHLGISDIDIKNAIENYKPANNRSQLLKTENNTIFLDAYNANPTSMKTAIDNIVFIKANNKVLILGDMLELGNETMIEHASIINYIQNKGFKNVYLIGENFAEVLDDKKYKSFINTSEFINWLKENKIYKSNILIKGSRGGELEKAVEYL